jgi:DNA-binding transcriptional ArsR family regulator
LKEIAIFTEDQLKSLVSPVRSEVFDAVRSLGSASATDIAKETDLSAETVHFHLKGLLKAELIVRCGQRSSARRPESLYESSALQFNLPIDSALSAVVSQAVMAGLRRTVRGYECAAVVARESEKPLDGFHIIQAKVQLSPRDMDQFLAMIERAAQFAREKSIESGSTHHWTSVVYPNFKKKS